MKSRKLTPPTTFAEFAAMAANEINCFHHPDEWCDVVNDKAMEICDHFGVMEFDQVTMERVVEMIWAKLS